MICGFHDDWSVQAPTIRRPQQSLLEKLPPGDWSNVPLENFPYAACGNVKFENLSSGGCNDGNLRHLLVSWMFCHLEALTSVVLKTNHADAEVMVG